MKAEEFAKTLYEEGQWLLPKGTDAQTAVDILADHFLGHDNTIIMGYSATNAQWNSEVVLAILRRYPQGKIRRIYKERGGDTR